MRQLSGKGGQLRQQTAGQLSGGIGALPGQSVAEGGDPILQLLRAGGAEPLRLLLELVHQGGEAAEERGKLLQKGVGLLKQPGKQPAYQKYQHHHKPQGQHRGGEAPLEAQPAAAPADTGLQEARQHKGDQKRQQPEQRVSERQPKQKQPGGGHRQTQKKIHLFFSVHGAPFRKRCTKFMGNWKKFWRVGGLRGTDSCVMMKDM